MNQQRRNVRNMPFRRRHDGLSVLERLAESKLWMTILTMLQICLMLPLGFLKVAFCQMCIALVAQAAQVRQLAWNPLDPISKEHADRGIDSFTDEDSYRHLRFRKPELQSLLHHLGFPDMILLDNGTSSSGEYAFCFMLYRLHYPSSLAALQSTFGRDYSQLSRIFKYAINLVYNNHSGKVLRNVYWYADRFDMYNKAYICKIAGLPENPARGHVPQYLSDLYGSLDCTAIDICRPHANNNAQFPFYNGYHHGHFLIWQGISFPDGMVVLEGPEPGYYTDTMVWRDCQLRHDLEHIMLEREAGGKQRLYLYADKIYNTGALIKASWSLRHGALQAWMVVQNGIMSRIRVSVEWAFNTIISVNKFAGFGLTQKMQQSPVARHYVVAVLLSNCRTCAYGGISNTYFGTVPPSLDEYFDQ